MIISASTNFKLCDIEKCRKEILDIQYTWLAIMSIFTFLIFFVILKLQHVQIRNHGMSAFYLFFS